MRKGSVLVALGLGVLLFGACQREEPVAEKPTKSPAASPQAREMAAGPAVTGLPEGELVYQDACASCHDTGIEGAPVTGNQDAWAERLIKGRQALVENTLRGIGNMPPRGGVPGLSDAEIAAAVDYMINRVH